MRSWLSIASPSRYPNTEFSWCLVCITDSRAVKGADPYHDVPKLVGSNGSGKSTLHGIIGNLISPTGGSITFSGGVDPPPRGSLGVVPQKNVLFPELTCYQTVRLWSAIKRPSGVAETDDSFLQLLVDCDLADKIHGRSGDLSGGQKRKLQLAIGLVGGSTSMWSGLPGNSLMWTDCFGRPISTSCRRSDIWC